MKLFAEALGNRLEFRCRAVPACGATVEVMALRPLSVPKTKFDNNAGGGHPRPAPMRCDLRAG